MVHILLPVHDRIRTTLAFVDCLKLQTYRNFRLVLVDDGCTDGTAAAVKATLPDAIVLPGRGNLWWAGSLQLAFNWLRASAIARDDVVLIMNDDTSFDPDFIAAGLRVLGENPATLLTATGYNLKTGVAQDSGGYLMDWKTLGFSETHDNSRMNCSSTRGLITRVGDFLDVGGFYPHLIPHYLSDIEFTMRAHERGKRLMIDSTFRIGIDFEATGHRDLGDVGFLRYLQIIFSKRAAMNPVYWSSFILLRSDARYKLRNLLQIWGAVYRQGILDRLVPEVKRVLRGKYKPASQPADAARDGDAGKRH
jgi:GT2 family glycosyltransferase